MIYSQFRCKFLVVKSWEHNLFITQERIREIYIACVAALPQESRRKKDGEKRDHGNEDGQIERSFQTNCGSQAILTGQKKQSSNPPATQCAISMLSKFGSMLFKLAGNSQQSQYYVSPVRNNNEHDCVSCRETGSLNSWTTFHHHYSPL